MKSNNERLSFYLEELNEWSEHIDYYLVESEEVGSKLYGLIRRNSIPDITVKVEERLGALNLITAHFNSLQQEIASLEGLLNPRDREHSNQAIIDSSIEQRQATLRMNMQAAEKAYVDTRYDCHQFLSDMLKL